MPQLNLFRIFVKGSSFEMPSASELFTSSQALELRNDVNVNVSYLEVSTDLFEVTVRVSLTLSRGVQRLCTAEIQQAGLFKLEGFQPAEIPAALRIGAASVVYPYLRVNLADMLTRATMPAVHLPDLDWKALFDAQAPDDAALSGAAAVLPVPAPSKLH